MKLTPPTRRAFWAASVFAAVGVMAMLGGIPVLAAIAFVVSTTILLAAATFTGI